ncbi:MAG: hypothetical protein KDH96_07525 [Candidatus Riesia sp.]|mgnify:CR=1 FL=1|nr:hypothetical protein [Candidatus Riesia sp.]
MDKNTKVILEMFDADKLTKIQQKINQWITIGHLHSYKISHMRDNMLLIEYVVYKSEDM